MKDLRRVDDEEVLAVRVDVGRLVKVDVREHGVCELVCVSVDLTDTVSPSWSTMSL